jgi:hypothetical protein
MDRKVSSSSVNLTKTEFLARGALNTVVAGLKNEIEQSSTIPGNLQDVKIYEPAQGMLASPLSGTNVQVFMQPLRSGTLNPNLIRVSDQAEYKVSINDVERTVFSAAASAVSSTMPSANGRSISLTRWNSHYLNPPASNVPNGDSTPDETKFTAPDWVLVTGSGPEQIPALDSTRKSGGANQVIGRYAFAIYDEGGLIDANVAGFPSALPGAAAGRKGSASLINLGLVIGGNGATSAQQNQAMDRLVGWRNFATAQASGDMDTGFAFAGSGSNYYDYLFPSDAVSGTVPSFLKVSSTLNNERTDQQFTSRQVLIKYQQAAWLRSNGAEFPPESLQYLGTFTRALNRPNFIPRATPRTGVALQSGVPDYTNPAMPKAINPIAHRVTISGTAGVSQRFSLAWLNLFPANPEADAGGDRQALIEKRFGLTPVAGRHQEWQYPDLVTDGDARLRLRTLDEISGREPNFFELLQAAILEGSLWVNGQGFSTARPMSASNAYTNYSDRASSRWVSYTTQLVFQIGVNIISQAQPHNFPLTIRLPLTAGGNTGDQFLTVTGVADLPYFSEMLFWPYRPTHVAVFTAAGAEPANGPEPTKPAPGDPDYREMLHAWLLFELWNPHRASAAVPSPRQIRLVVRPENPAGGATRFQVRARDTLSANKPSNEVPAAPATSVYSNEPDGAPVNKQAPIAWDPSSKQNYQPQMWVTLDYATGDYREPALVDGAKAIHAEGDSKFFQTVSDNGKARFGLWIGQAGDPAIGLPDRSYAVENNLPVLPDFPEYDWSKVEYLDPNGTSVALQYLHPDGQWYYYQGAGWDLYDRDLTRVMVAVNQSAVMADPLLPTLPTFPAWITVKDSNHYTEFDYVLAQSVQRADPRTIVNPGRFTGDPTPDATISGAAGQYYWPIWPTSYAMPTAAGGSWSGPTPNRFYPELYFANSATVSGNRTYLVDADGVLRPGDGGIGAPSIYSGTDARPVFLHRPLRSVAEMGYANRGAGAWKSLNFFSPESADAGLLDYFSADDAPVTAGKINLNTRQVETLAAALAGTARDPLGDDNAGNFFTVAEARQLAEAIVRHTAAQPLVSRADLVRELLGDSAIVSVIDAVSGGGIKSRREAFVRALADAGTTRTWNLLIDVIAQSGQYAHNASRLDQFTVEGEKRYWLHVAIDRYTGEVIDRQLEEVNE